jgi:lipopolysaccharide transport system permease protein
VPYPLAAVKAALPAPLYAVYVMNPMTGVVDTFRRAIVLHQSPDFPVLAVSALVVAILMPLAYVYFKYVELTMADVV